MHQLLTDLRLAAGSVVSRPLLFFVATTSLAVGIGTDTAIFTAVNRLVLRPPEGIPLHERLVDVGIGGGFSSWSYPDFLDIRAQADPLDQVVAYDIQPVSLSRGDEGLRVFGLIVSANYFAALGVTPSQGRFFLPHEDEGLGEHRVAVVGVTKPEFRGHVPVLAPDLRVLGFALALTLGTGLIFGLLPAVQATRLDLVPTLKDEGSRGRSAPGRLRRFFVASQVAFSLVLLVSAGLFLRSLQLANRLEKGFDPTSAHRTSVDLTIEGYSPDEGAGFQRQLLGRLAQESWVESAALASDLPLDLSVSRTIATPEGLDPELEENWVSVDFNRVSEEYFNVLRIPMLEGRAFLGTHNADSELVVVVSRTWVDQVWPGERVVGRSLRFWGAERTVVGVAEDTKNNLVTDEPQPMLYIPIALGAEKKSILRLVVGVAFTLLGMVVLATIVPARRAAGVQPAEALRNK